WRPRSRSPSWSTSRWTPFTTSGRNSRSFRTSWAASARSASLTTRG
ncbi:MAG: Predicted integral membrane protein, partial [uncultured Solirubrobacteraceae bacterium]